jgi:hypothetical protein
VGWALVDAAAPIANVCRGQTKFVLGRSRRILGIYTSGGSLTPRDRTLVPSEIVSKIERERHVEQIVGRASLFRCSRFAAACPGELQRQVA